MDAVMVKEEVAKGMAFVCATCERYPGMASGRNCTPPSPCGGPISGRAFPQYRGILAGNLDNVCFRCGDEATNGIRVKITGEVVGACDKHVTMVEQYQQKGATCR